MKIISFLNISNPDNIETDSGWIFQKALKRSIEKIGHTYILMSYGQAEPFDFTKGLNNPYLDKFNVRYTFNWQRIAEVIEQERPDIILSNQPELSTNLKSILVSRSVNARLYTYVHYQPYFLHDDTIQVDPSLDNGGLGKSIILSFIAGITASDRVFVHSDFALRQLRQAVLHFKQQVSTAQFVVLPPPFDPYIAESHEQPKQEHSLLYNHRLYTQYGTDHLLSFAEAISETRNWKIVVTDMLHNENKNRMRLDDSTSRYRDRLKGYPNVELRHDGNVRGAYRDIIRSSKVGIAPYRTNCPWSMSVIDCLSAGVPVVAPRFAWFKEFLPAALTYETMAEKIAIVSRLLSDDVFYRDTAAVVMEKVCKNNMLNEDYTASVLTG